MSPNEVEFTQNDQIFTHLPGQKGVFPGMVMFSFSSPYDKGAYYIIRMDQTVRDNAGQPWETFEVRSSWQLTRNEDITPPFTEDRTRLDTLTSELPRPHISDAEANFAALNPAAEIARSEEEDDDENSEK